MNFYWNVDEMKKQKHGRTFEASSSFTLSSLEVSLAFRAAISCSSGITTDRSFSASSWAFGRAEEIMSYPKPWEDSTLSLQAVGTSTCSDGSLQTVSEWETSLHFCSLTQLLQHARIRVIRSNITHNSTDTRTPELRGTNVALSR